MVTLEYLTFQVAENTANVKTMRNSNEIITEEKAFRFVKIDLEGAIDLVKRMSNGHDNRHLYSE